MTVGVGTAVRANYLPFARVLAQSLAQHHPELPFHLLLVDEAGDRFDPAAEPFAVVETRELPIPRLRERLFRYNDRESVVAGKADVLAYLLDRYDATLFVDADILLLGAIDGLLEQVAAHAITLTPHLLPPPLATGDRAEREMLVLLAGAYNGGVLGLSDRPEARALLDWWRDRLELHCRHSVDEGLHYDQRWLDLVPAFFDDVHLVRDPALNVAHWNLPEREDVDATLFHFSGYRPDHPETVTHYASRLAMADVPRHAPLFERYREAVIDAGWLETREWAYAYGAFDDGVPIPALARELYARVDPARFGDPFAAGPGTFRAWLAGGDLPPLWEAVLDRRPDVRDTFPDPGGADRAAFRAWALDYGADEYEIDPRLVPAP